VVAAERPVLADCCLFWHYEKASFGIQSNFIRVGISPSWVNPKGVSFQSDLAHLSFGTIFPARVTDGIRV
jgi:hypothetical protein